MKQLNNFIFKYSKRKIDKNRRKKQFLSYENIKSILLLYSSDWVEKNKEIKQIIKSLEKDHKVVTAIGFVNKAKITTPILQNSCIIGKKNISFTEKPINLEQLVKKEFDIVIDLSTEPYMPLLYLLLHAKALCKIGLQHNKYKLLDFIIQFPKAQITSEINQPIKQEISVEELFAQILFYLKTIRSND